MRLQLRWETMQMARRRWGYGFSSVLHYKFLRVAIIARDLRHEFPKHSKWKCQMLNRFKNITRILAIGTLPEITASLSLPGFQRIIPLWVELVARYREGLHFFIRNFNSLWVEVVV